MSVRFLCERNGDEASVAAAKPETVILLCLKGFEKGRLADGWTGRRRQVTKVDLKPVKPMPAGDDETIGPRGGDNDDSKGLAMFSQDDVRLETINFLENGS